MCGIAGLIACSESAARGALPAMVAAQSHRGPDDQGEQYHLLAAEGGLTLGLGHRRLSILDLSSAGHQPMAHPGTGSQIVFNGEIYNFATLRRDLEAASERFTGHSDTEVMLHALCRWGPECIGRFQGMFAFAFFDRQNHRLVLARDSIGIKPLYVASAPGAVCFASEVRAVLASGLVPRKIDTRGLAGLLAYGAVPQPCTLFQSVRSFPPGCYQVIDLSNPSAIRQRLEAGNAILDSAPAPFWAYPRPRREMTEPEAVGTVAGTLESAVRDHLVSDVPVGVFLSSGLDSTIVAALAARHSPQVRSFTVGFADQPDMSESAPAAETARQCGLEHTDIQITGAQAEAAAVAWAQGLDQPSMDGLNVYVISQAVRAQGIVVALSGQGGDELFGGYPSFSDVPRLTRALGRAAWLPAPARVAAARVVTARKSLAVREKLADMARSGADPIALCLHRRRAMSNGQLAALGLTPGPLGLTATFMPPEALAGVVSDPDDLPWTVSQIEGRFYQGNVLLRDSDANGMAHGLEIRVPLLDQRMLDFMYTVPGRVRLPSGRANKHLLREAFGPLLRPELLAQKKRGFSLPIRRWMLGPLRDLCASGLRDLKSLGVLRPEGVDTVWKAFLAEPESPIWSRAFTLAVLGTYLRQMKVTANEPRP